MAISLGIYPIFRQTHMITVLEVLHDVIIVIFPFFTNQTPSQLHNSQSRGVQRRLGLLQRAEVSEKSESEKSSIVGPCNMNNMKSWKNLGPPNLPIFMENLSCFIMFYLSQHSQNCTNCTWSWISCSCSSQSPHLSMGALTIPVC